MDSNHGYKVKMKVTTVTSISFNGDCNFCHSYGISESKVKVIQVATSIDSIVPMVFVTFISQIKSSVWLNKFKIIPTIPAILICSNLIWFDCYKHDFLLVGLSNEHLNNSCDSNNQQIPLFSLILKFNVYRESESKIVRRPSILTNWNLRQQIY